jgi:hypothetical protein
MVFYKGRNILHVKIQSPVASSEHLRTFCLAVGRRVHGYEKCVGIGNEDLNVYVLNSGILYPSVLVLYTAWHWAAVQIKTFYIRNCVSGVKRNDHQIC